MKAVEVAAKRARDEAHERDLTAKEERITEAFRAAHMEGGRRGGP